MKKEKVEELRKELEKIKDPKERNKFIESLSKKYDFESVDINQIRKEVYAYMAKYNTPTQEEMHRKFNV